MENRNLAALLVLAAAAGAVLYARRARAASSSSRDELGPLYTGDLNEPIVITAPPLVIPGVNVPPPDRPALERVAVTVQRILGGAVDQVTDALKGLGLWSHKVPEKYRPLFASAGAAYRLPPGLLEAVAYAESRFREDIITGQVRSSAGAVGIMQIVPKWHPELGEAGALDPAQAVPYAARYLRAHFERFGSWRLALAAYNWGQGNLAKAIKAGTPNAWPAETVAYVNGITTNAGLA